ncbi:SdrD B-like domain-containing protein [uncultured Clostridium sp.]|uniref:SdrD B-like domain-containing protein n=1 Tax=uncultured Clostridium sp. TaxID=59620 RepID=UPI0028EA972D|nr:SdrD B-like domain-containing protein [uncultured Clostridium sp.]
MNKYNFDDELDCEFIECYDPDYNATNQLNESYCNNCNVDHYSENYNINYKLDNYTNEKFAKKNSGYSICGTVYIKNYYNASPAENLSCCMIELYTCDNVFLKRVITDSCGKYCFNDLSSGKYKIRVITNDNYELAEDTCNSKFDLSTGLSNVLNIHNNSINNLNILLIPVFDCSDYC